MALSLPIDVIVPAFNAAAYLPESLGSIASQTCRVNEVIVVDDGSTDDTATVARSLGATVLSRDNGGLAEARNSGIRKSRAPFIALLDADDRWHPQRLELQWGLHELRPDVYVIATDYARWTDDTLGGSTLHEQPAFAAAPRERVTPEGFVIERHAMLAALAVRNCLLPSSMLLDRRIFDGFGIYYRAREFLEESDNALVGEDYEWLMRALRVSDIAFVDRVLVDYRQSATSLSARRGRIRYGDVVLGKMIAASPAAYVAGAPAEFARRRPMMLRDSALAHARDGEFDFTIARLRELASCTPEPQSGIASLAAWLVGLGSTQRLLRGLTALRRPRFR